jgi:hypothetical protein
MNVHRRDASIEHHDYEAVTTEMTKQWGKELPVFWISRPNRDEEHYGVKTIRE